MRGSPLVYELEDPMEFCLEPLTDSRRPGVQTALPRCMMAPAEAEPDTPEAPPSPSLRQRLNTHASTIVFVSVMALSCAVRWGA